MKQKTIKKHTFNFFSFAFAYLVCDDVDFRSIFNLKFYYMKQLKNDHVFDGLMDGNFPSI